jgi:hypothetical protein
MMKNKRLELADISNLNNYEFSCPHCGQPFSVQQLASNAQCPHCQDAWRDIGIIVIDGGKAPQSSSPDFLAALLVTILLAIIGYGLYTTIATRVAATRFGLQTFWFNLVEGVKAWFDGVGQLGLTFISLSIFTFVALLVYYSLIYLISTMIKLFTSQPEQIQPGLSLNAVMVGTIGNLFAGSCALLCIPLILHRTPDILDFGVQFLIALIVEYLILRER